MFAKKLLVFAILVSVIVTPSIAAEGFPALSSSVDKRLQDHLEHKLQQIGLEQAAKRGDLTVALTDITNPAHPRVATINAEKMMYAASLPKIAILLGAFVCIEQGEITLNEQTRETLVRMIRYSSNTAATEMLNRVGKEKLAKILQSPRFAFYDYENNGGLWVGKDYGKASAWKRDPLANLSHGANAFQVARFYYMLETGQLFSSELNKEMKAILGNPGINHKFVKGLNTSRPGSQIYRKSGTWRAWHSDSAIVERDGRRYIAVALAHSENGSQWLQDLIVALDDLVFETAPANVALLD